VNVQWPYEPGTEQPEFVSFRMKTLIAVERLDVIDDISEVQRAAMQKISDRLVCEIRSAFMVPTVGKRRLSKPWGWN
jgi:hypothetical protein